MTALSRETIPFHPTIVRGSLWVGSGFLGQQGIAVVRTMAPTALPA